jgi:hypothetical protein
MLCDYVGEEKFLKGVSIYLKKRQYANSVTADLWEGISVATGMNPNPSSCSTKANFCIRHRRRKDHGELDDGSQLNRFLYRFPLTLLFKDGIPCPYGERDRCRDRHPPRSIS